MKLVSSAAEKKPKDTSRLWRTHRTRLLLLIGALLVVLTLAVVVPLSVILTQRAREMGPRASVMVPLYVYPERRAWDPLYRA